MFYLLENAYVFYLAVSLGSFLEGDKAGAGGGGDRPWPPAPGSQHPSAIVG